MHWSGKLVTGNLATDFFGKKNGPGGIGIWLKKEKFITAPAPEPIRLTDVIKQQRRQFVKRKRLNTRCHKKNKKELELAADQFWINLFIVCIPPVSVRSRASVLPVPPGHSDNPHLAYKAADD